MTVRNYASGTEVTAKTGITVTFTVDSLKVQNLSEGGVNQDCEYEWQMYVKEFWADDSTVVNWLDANTDDHWDGLSESLPEATYDSSKFDPGTIRISYPPQDAYFDNVAVVMYAYEDDEAGWRHEKDDWLMGYIKYYEFSDFPWDAGSVTAIGDKEGDANKITVVYTIGY